MELAMAILFGLLLVVVASEQFLSAADLCRRRCGSQDVPYPFGIDGDDPSCYINDDFRLKCNNSFAPQKLFRGDFEIIEVNISSAKMRGLLELTYDCYNASGNNDSSSWVTQLRSSYTYSNTDNIVVALGCDIIARVLGQSKAILEEGCISFCNSLENVLDGDCSGAGCCEMSIPKGLRTLNFSLHSFENHSGILDFNPCGYLFLVEKNNYTFRASDLKSMPIDRRFPVVWDWNIGNISCQKARRNKTNYACLSSNSRCVNAINGPGYVCNCSVGYKGNPYVHDGCQDIDECEDHINYPCNGTCINTLGSYDCTCPQGFNGNPRTYGCTQISTSSIRLVTTIIIPAGIAVFLFALAISIWIYSVIQKRKFIKLKDMYFRQNGGLILQKELSSRDDIQKTFKIFTKEEIDKATNNFDTNNVIGHGGQGVVFKGKLADDNGEFAVKKSILLDGSKIEEFINELVILSQINHRNVVRLIGCCLDVEYPLLVYEFIPNGTLYNHIHNGCLQWGTRLKIVAEIADGLSHLHFKVHIPIIHRDVKSSNILINADYTAKISDFGASKMVATDELQVVTLIQGTMGYLDPEYIQNHMLTDKSDVYSFGVVLLEILTGKLPFSQKRYGSENSLVNTFISYMKNNNIDDILDERVVNTSTIDQMKDVANLAMRCLFLRGEERPSMIEVSRHLEEIRRTSHHSCVVSRDEDEQNLRWESLSIARESSTCITEEQTITFLETENGR